MGESACIVVSTLAAKLRRVCPFRLFTSGRQFHKYSYCEVCGDWTMASTAGNVTELLQSVRNGNKQAEEKLIHVISDASAATIGVEEHVITRLLALKNLTVEIRAGRAIRKYKAVKSSSPDDLVFQSVKDGLPMNDQNILKRHLQPAARKLGLPFVNWRCLRTSHATWLVQAGADPKSVQGQMRHSRISTTMDIYAQIVPEAQRRALKQLSEFHSRSITVQ